MLLQKNWKENGCWFKLPRGPQPFWFLTPPVRTLLFLTLGGTCVGELQNAPWLQKKSLIVWVSHTCLSTCWFALATLLDTGSLREYSVTSIMILLWACQSFSDSGRVSPVGSWCLFSLCLLHRGFHHRASGDGLRTVFCTCDGTLSPCVFQVLGNLFHLFPKWYFYLFIFLPTFNGSFLPPSHIKAVCIEFFSSSGWRLVCRLESNFRGRFISFFSTSFGLVPSWTIWCCDQFKKEPLYFNGWNQASQIWRSKRYRLAPGLDPSNPSAHKSWCLLPLKFCNVIKENSSNQWFRASRDEGFPVTKGTEQVGLVSLINTGTLGTPS